MSQQVDQVQDYNFFRKKTQSKKKRIIGDEILFYNYVWINFFFFKHDFNGNFLDTV